jgi:hypothetical protein
MFFHSSCFCSDAGIGIDTLLVFKKQHQIAMPVQTKKDGFISRLGDVKR